jgi:hypothetical protein
MHRLYVYAAGEIVIYILQKGWIFKHMNRRPQIPYFKQKKNFDALAKIRNLVLYFAYELHNTITLASET